MASKRIKVIRINIHTVLQFTRVNSRSVNVALDKAYLATMKCAVVSKAFKKVSKERTKFKQIKHQLKALGFDNEYAGQTADELNNACWVWIILRKSRRT